MPKERTGFPYILQAGESGDGTGDMPSPLFPPSLSQRMNHITCPLPHTLVSRGLGQREPQFGLVSEASLNLWTADKSCQISHFKMEGNFGTVIATVGDGCLSISEVIGCMQRGISACGSCFPLMEGQCHTLH